MLTRTAGIPVPNVNSIIEERKVGFEPAPPGSLRAGKVGRLRPVVKIRAASSSNASVGPGAMRVGRVGWEAKINNL